MSGAVGINHALEQSNNYLYVSTFVSRLVQGLLCKQTSLVTWIIIKCNLRSYISQWIIISWQDKKQYFGDTDRYFSDTLLILSSVWSQAEIIYANVGFAYSIQLSTWNSIQKILADQYKDQKTWIFCWAVYLNYKNH